MRKVFSHLVKYLVVFAVGVQFGSFFLGRPSRAPASPGPVSDRTAAIRLELEALRRREPEAALRAELKTREPARGDDDDFNDELLRRRRAERALEECERSKDWAHCLGNEKVSTGSKKYVVVIPSVKRVNDEYLRKTLDSLEKARPADVSVLLVNANQPPEEHTYLREWCSSHKSYECIEPPQVSESLIKDAISNDKRGDTPQYLRWRTMEATHAIFGMSEFLKTGAEYMIWLQDDVTIDEDLFSSLPKEEIVCLRSDGYCGMVAYMFKKSFVRKLIPKLKKNFKNMPIDWIVDQTRGRKVIRIPKVYHHGIISSNGKTREATEKEAKLNAKAI